VSGHTPLTFAALPPAIPLVKEGKLRALAVVGPDRVDALPDVPTMAQAGTPGFDAQSNLEGRAIPPAFLISHPRSWNPEFPDEKRYFVT